jgi:hypothetical protein
MSSKKDVQPKEVWCLAYYAKHLRQEGYDVKGYYECRYEDGCYCAHTQKDIKIKPHISKWAKESKDKIDLLKIMEKIITIIKKSSEDVVNPKYRSMIMNIEKLRFDELLHVWFDITCYHRRIAKSDKINYKKFSRSSTPISIEGFQFKDDIPLFKLDEIEDDVWALQRTLRLCKKNEETIPGVPIYIKELCCGDINCKEGVHALEHLVCVDNMIDGKCKCPTFEQNETMKKSYIAQGQVFLEIINCPGVEKKERADAVIEYNKIVSKYKKIEKYTKMIHLTEQGLIPLCERIKAKAKEGSDILTVDEVISNVKSVEKIKRKEYK